MNKIKKSERGQAIVLIALAIIGLFGLIALAMDGGHAFSDRRQAQNAADAAALAVAMNYAHNSTTQKSLPDDMYAILSPIALASTTLNGYDNDGTHSVVVLTKPFRDATTDECKNGGLAFQVDIDSNLSTWFGPIIGVSQVHNHVTSTSLGCKPYNTVAYNGNAVVTLDKTACPALSFGGGSTTTVTSSTNQGIYVESNCSGLHAALTASNNTSIKAPNVNVVGDINNSSQFKDPDGNTLVSGSTINSGAALMDEIKWPSTAEICPTNPVKVDPDKGSKYLMPGQYPTGTVWSSTDSFPPFNDAILEPGVYCLDNTFKITGGTLSGVGVTIVQRHNLFSIGGNGNVTLEAPTSGITKGLLIYMPSSNPDAAYNAGIDIVGNGGSTYIGSIIAPSGHIKLTGSSSSAGTFQTQVVGLQADIGGGAGLFLNYDAQVLYQPPHPAGIQLIK